MKRIINLSWKWRIFLFTMLTLSPLHIPLMAHSIVFRNGQIMYGSVSNQDKEYVYVNAGSGLKKVLKKEISIILYQDVKDPESLKGIMRQIARNENSRADSDLSDIKFYNLKDFLDEAKKDSLKEEDFHLKMGGALRSALFPGWGQYYKNQPWRGAVYASLFLASAGSAISADASYRKAVTKANDPLPYLAVFLTMGPSGALPVNYLLAQPRHRAVDRQAHRADAFLISTGAVWIIAIGDAILFSPDRKEESVSFFVSPGSAGFRFRF